MANVITNTHTNYKRKQVRHKTSLNAKRLGSCMTRKVLIGQAKILTTSNHYAKAARPHRAI